MPISGMRYFIDYLFMPEKASHATAHAAALLPQLMRYLSEVQRAEALRYYYFRLPTYDDMLLARPDDIDVRHGFAAPHAKLRRR